MPVAALLAIIVATTAVRRTATPAKRQRGGYGYRPHYSGDYNADHYRNEYSYGCNTVFIPYGWTWYRASNC